MTHRDHLPQLDGGVFATDGGIETTLIFHEGHDLPLFAAFDLLKDDAGTEALRSYFERYAALAVDRGVGLVLESPTWRSSPRWAQELGYSAGELDRMNRKAIALMEDVRARYESAGTPIVISGCVGPQGRRLQPSGDPQFRRGERVPRRADPDVRGHRRRPGHRDHHDVCG